jgi:hypothetical protein
MDAFMMLSGFLLLAVLLGFTGVCMLASPRRFAAVCEVFAEAGGLPSLLPRSVKGALLQVRAFGVCALVGGFLLLAGSVELMGTPGAFHPGPGAPKLYWMVVPAMLGISAGYVILVYGTEWLTRIFSKWMDHPLVPHDLVVAFTWELRVAGAAFTLFGLGATSLWLRSLLG